MLNYTAYLPLMFDAFQDAVNGRKMINDWKKMGVGLSIIQFERDDYNLDKWLLRVEYYDIELEINLDSSMSYKAFVDAFKKALDMKIKKIQRVLSDLQCLEIID